MTLQGFQPSNSLDSQRPRQLAGNRDMATVPTTSFYGGRGEPQPGKRPPQSRKGHEAEPEEIVDDDEGSGRENVLRTGERQRKRRKLERTSLGPWRDPVEHYYMGREDGPAKAFDRPPSISGQARSAASRVAAMKGKNGGASSATQRPQSSVLKAGDFPKIELNALLVGERLFKPPLCLMFVPGNCLRIIRQGSQSLLEAKYENVNNAAVSTESDAIPCFIFSTKGSLPEAQFKAHYHGGEAGKFLKTPKNQIICVARNPQDLRRFKAEVQSKSFHPPIRYLSPEDATLCEEFLRTSSYVPESSEQSAEVFAGEERRRSGRRTTMNSRSTLLDDSPPPSPAPTRQSTRTRKRKLELSEELFTYESIVIRGEDYGRLEEGQFLNDSVIELQLKRIFAELPPEIQEATYIFNSFFYQQLSSGGKSDPASMHRRVRRWTSKVDLFEKKYIVVPINESLHWYLAIICNPEAILSGGSKSDAATSDYAEPEPRSKHHVPVLTLDSSDVEEDFQEPADIQAKPGVEPDSEPKPTPGLRDAGSPDDGAGGGESSAGANSSHGASAQAVNTAQDADGGAPSPVEEDVQWDDDGAPPGEEASAVVRDGEEQVDGEKGIMESLMEGIASISGLASRAMGWSDPDVTKTAGNGHADVLGSLGIDPGPTDDAVDGGADPDRDGEPRPEASRGYIFQFDSLGGSKGNEVANALNSYLREEARAKRGIVVPNSSKLRVVHADNIPKQSNHSDCGLFLLKYVEKFLKDPPRMIGHLLHPEVAKKDLWFKGAEAKKLRTEIRVFLNSKMEEKEAAAKAQAAAGKEEPIVV